MEKSEEILKQYVRDNEYTEKYLMPYKKFSAYFYNLEEYLKYLKDDEDLIHLSESIEKAIELVCNTLLKENDILLSQSYTKDLDKIVEYFDNLKTEPNNKLYDYNLEYNKKIEKLKKAILIHQKNAKKI